MLSDAVVQEYLAHTFKKPEKSSGGNKNAIPITSHFYHNLPRYSLHFVLFVRVD